MKPAYQSFEEIPAWQKARVLNDRLFTLSENQRFRKDLLLFDQMLHAGSNIMDEIARGFGRCNTSAMVCFLEIAAESVSALQSQLYRMLDRKYMSGADFTQIYSQLDDIKKLLQQHILCYVDACTDDMRMKGYN